MSKVARKREKVRLWGREREGERERERSMEIGSPERFSESKRPLRR
jgi:hypothetical protein